MTPASEGGGMHLVEALAVVRGARGKRDVVITTMAPARDWMAMSKGSMAALDLVLVPSAMGQATSMGLGIALAQPDRRVIVCNGDGSMLMNLGSMVSIVAAAPKNLVLLVFDNGVYEVTGAQVTPGAEAGVNFARWRARPASRRCMSFLTSRRGAKRSARSSPRWARHLSGCVSTLRRDCRARNHPAMPRNEVVDLSRRCGSNYPA